MGVHFLSRYRNPLAYPAGYAPGFDPSHVAVKQARTYIFSGISVYGNFVDLRGGAPGANTGSPPPSISGILGPSTYYGEAAGTLTICDNALPTSSFAPTSFTGAAIFEVRTAFAAGTSVLVYGPGGGGGGTGIGLAYDGTQFPGIVAVGGVNAYAPVALNLNTPYFLLGINEPAGGVAYIILTDLVTGRVSFWSVTRAVPGVAVPGSSAIYVGNTTSNRAANVNIAAAMWSSTNLSLAEGLVWAADPWSFWYPNPGDNWIAAQAAAGFPYWAARNNNFVIGTGVQ